MTPSLGHRVGTAADLVTLAQMNQQLIEDEGHRNPMTLAQLETRMRHMLEENYTATIFERDDQDVAYALWREEPDWVYLRQFFVSRAFRRQGIGAKAIRLLVDEIWPTNKRVRVNVLIGNRPALEFWRAVGFADYLITLEMDTTP